MSGLARALFLVVTLSLCLPALAQETPEEARLRALQEKLRCLVCQNQTIADSHSGLAEDLRRELRDQLQRGASDDQVRHYMTERYGDFVLYRPPVKPLTWLLWAGPALLLAGAGTVLGVTLHRRSRLGAERFEPDASADRDADAPSPPPIR